MRYEICFNTCSSCEEQHGVDESDSELSVSIHAPLARSNFPEDTEQAGMGVSIHAPLARSNRRGDNGYDGKCDVSIHAPLARSNQCVHRGIRGESCFNTCSSCEEQLVFPVCPVVDDPVSIHAPLARSNKTWCNNRLYRTSFQYMLLLRGATLSAVKVT